MSDKEGGQVRWTPGPWAARQRDFGYPDYEDGPIVRLWDVYARRAGCVACGTIFGDSEANAHLIAAAPTLYELLKECADELEAIYRHEHLPNGEADAHPVSLRNFARDMEVVNAARAALALARGEVLTPTQRSDQ